MGENKLKVGVIGAGFMGTAHADIWHKMEGASVTALLEGNRERGAEIVEKTGCTRFIEEEAFFAKGDFNIVDICVPTAFHESLAVKALDCGNHVLCEKPVSLSVESALRIKEKVEKTGKKFMVAQVIRFWPQYRKIAEMTAKGAIGDVQKVHAHRISESPKWGGWFRKPELGGGALYDLHIHDLDYIYSLFGAPEEVFARGRQGEFGAWDSFTSTLSWREMTATIEADWTYPGGFPFQFGIRLKGTEGTLMYSFKVSGNVESKDAAEESFLYITPGNIEEIDCSGMDEGYTAEIAYMAECVRADKPVEQATIGEAVEVLRLVDRERESMEAGKRIL